MAALAAAAAAAISAEAASLPGGWDMGEPMGGESRGRLRGGGCELLVLLPTPLASCRCCTRSLQYHLFLTSLAERRSNALAIFDHGIVALGPFLRPKISSTMIERVRSSCSVHFILLTAGFTWLCHLRAHARRRGGWAKGRLDNAQCASVAGGGRVEGEAGLRRAAGV